MSRNYDILTSVPYNSTLQDDLEPQSFSIMENDLETEQNFEEIDEYNTVTEDDDVINLSEYEDLYQTDSSQRLSLENFRHKNSNRTQVENKVFKSFQEKFPINLQRSSSYYEEDDDYFEIENGLRLSKINQRKSSGVTQKFEKQDLTNKKIYQELNVIHNKLVDEYKVLQKREEVVRQRELKIKADEERLLKLANLDTKLKIEEIKLNYDKELDDLKTEFKDKFKEHKRLHEAFKEIKNSNDNLKQQLNEKNECNLKLEKQYNSLNSRFTNLQKKMELSKPVQDQIDAPKTTVRYTSNSKPHQKTTAQSANQITISQQTLVHNANILEAFAMLLDWLSQVSLKETLNFNLPLSGNLQILDKTCRLLPLLAELIIHLNSACISNLMANSFKKYHLAFLEFIYWSMLHYDASYQNHVKVNLTSTFRRIGEELYRSYNVNYQSNNNSASDLACVKNNQFSNKMEDEDDKTPNVCLFSLFLQSGNPAVRMLSCLIILRTLSQADYINNIFDILRSDLKDDTLKKLFLNYYGTWTIIKWCKLSNKHFLSCSVDTYLQMSSDWEHLETFLESCSNESWFSHISVILKNTNMPNGVKLEINFLEKLSVLLQKLSKKKQNRKYFDMFSIGKVCNDLLQKHYYESTFLIKNLKSILINLYPNSKAEKS